MDRHPVGNIQRGHHAIVQGGVADIVGHIQILHGVVLKDLGHGADVVVIVVGKDDTIEFTHTIVTKFIEKFTSVITLVTKIEQGIVSV